MVNRKGIYYLILSFSFLVILKPIGCIDYKPWTGNFLEFEWRNSLAYQNYTKVAVKSDLENYSSNDLFFTSSLGNSIDFLALELELTLAHTKKQKFDVDNFRIAGKYIWLDDVAGDPISLATGAVFTRAFNRSLHDISSFHHGKSEAEVYVSIGKELEQSREDWVQRCWAVAGLGSAVQRDAPWFRGIVGYEYRFSSVQEVGIFVNSLIGFGGEKLKRHFFGYGPVQHQSLDLGIRYIQLIPYFGDIKFEYAYRPYARNFPARAHYLLFSLLYTFGL